VVQKFKINQLAKSFLLFLLYFQFINSFVAHVKRYVFQFLRRGRSSCMEGHGPHPLYVNVDMTTGQTATNWIDSLQAAFPGVQVS
jgi:hypothetical protein